MNAMIDLTEPKVFWNMRCPRPIQRRWLRWVILALLVGGLLFTNDARADLPRDKVAHFAVSGMVAMGIAQLTLKHFKPKNRWGAFMMGVVCTSMGGAAYELLHYSNDSWDDMKADFLGSVVGAGLTVAIDF